MLLSLLSSLILIWLAIVMKIWLVHSFVQLVSLLSSLILIWLAIVMKIWLVHSFVQFDYQFYLSLSRPIHLYHPLLHFIISDLICFVVVLHFKLDSFTISKCQKSSFSPILSLPSQNLLFIGLFAQVYLYSCLLEDYSLSLF